MYIVTYDFNMHDYRDYINRKIELRLETLFKEFPAVALLGPRQCGKSTLAKNFLKSFSSSTYLDLERPSHISRLENTELYFEANRNAVICLDEVQRKPELFPVLRSVIDDNLKSGQILILGSASGELLRQSSESLAGRIAYLELTPFFFQSWRKQKK